MPRLIITGPALGSIERCRKFLHRKSPLAAQRAMQVIRQQIRVLTITPEIGRPMDDSPGVRELIIDFGDSGYLARYRYLAGQDAVHITAFRHQKEADY